MALRELDVGAAHRPQALTRVLERIGRVAQKSEHGVTGALVDRGKQVVLVGEQQVQVADGVADGLRDLAHREAGDAFLDDEQLGGGERHLALLFSRVFVAASHGADSSVIMNIVHLR